MLNKILFRRAVYVRSIASSVKAFGLVDFVQISVKVVRARASDERNLGSAAAAKLSRKAASVLSPLDLYNGLLFSVFLQLSWSI